jgi:leader peptidase (prepilin peptidase) / N-methyltransferase
MTSISLVALMGGMGLGVGVLLNAIVYHAQHGERGGVSVRYVSVEVAGAVLFAALTLRFGLRAELPAYLYLVTVGLALTMMDFDLRRLPASIILPSYVMTVMLLMPAGAVSANWYAGVRSLSGMAALLALYFALALAYPNGLGFGDVKLAGLVGLYLGWLSWNALFLTAIGSLLIACVGGAAVQVTRQATSAVAVRITPCLVSAAVLALFVTAPISNWYASLLPA